MCARARTRVQACIVRQAAKGTILWIPTGGALSHEQCRAYAASLGFSLPTQGQLVEVIRASGRGPLFSEDIWSPVSAHENAWVSVGNYDPAKRLGRLHEESCGGPPGWGPLSAPMRERRWMAVVGHRQL